MPERTPPLGTPSNDPEQLGLGMFEGTPLIPAGEKPRGDDGDSADSDAAVAVREPPVCGEWSFDLSDDADARGGATFVDQAAKPGASAAPQTRENTLNAERRSTAAPVPAAGSPPAPVPPPPSPPLRSLRTPPINRTITPPTPLPALAELKSIHDAHPGDVKTAVALSNALDKRGNIEGALSVLMRAIDAGADGVVLRCARATILSNRLRYDDAEAELKKAAKLRGDDPEVLLQQGILACRRAKWRDAVEPLAHVAKLSPQSGPAHFYLGEALNKLDRLKEALDAYERASELEPNNWRALKGVGIVLDRM
ncbi:MAG TPA: tetratricopeptide repeat protein, partial [Gemmatimonadaceae bacterium]|nr:tetratricopeptide repeat protein [Gemmatimonadaceae bacterium]